MPSNRLAPNVGYVEDAAEDSCGSVDVIEGTRRYAISEAPRSPERPNTGKTRGERRALPSDSEDDSSVSLTDSDETPRSAKQERVRPSEPRRSSHKDRERHRDRELEREREREHRRRERKRRDEEEIRKAARAEAKARDSRALKKTRPSAPKHAATQPVVSQSAYRRGHFDDPAAYGVQQPATSGSRPRAKTRPASYYAGQQMRPPPLELGWPGPPPPGSFPVGSFPPPPQMFGGPGGHPMPHGMHPPPSPMGMGPPPSFFDGQMGPPPSGDNLRHRFDKRPSSAMGFNSPPSGMSYLPEDYEEEPPAQHVARRPPRLRKGEDDRKKMPPPDFIPKRTQSARPTTNAFQAPPTQRERPPSRQNQHRPPNSHRRSVGFADRPAFEDDDIIGEDIDLFHDVSPNQRRHALTQRRRRSSVQYDHHGLDIVPAKSRGRRSSVYGAHALESGGVSLEEDKYLDAVRYQEDVSGGAPVPLTAETLRKASRRGEVASSRSTRSSGSRDESDYKRSNTTAITQSSTGKDDFTIKVSGQAVVRVSGAEIACDGGEITFSRPPGASRAGSDRDSTVYQLEDARSSRMERKALPHRPRAPSQSDSQSRGYPALHAPYEHAPYDSAPYEHAPYEQLTYEHAPYDPSLAASNFY